MIHIWGSTNNNADTSNYLSVLSIACDDTIILVRFKRLADHLKTVAGYDNLQDFFMDKTIVAIFNEILDGIESDENNLYFSYSLVNKEYVRFMAYYSEQLEDEQLNGNARVKSLDDIFGSVDSALLSKFPNLSEVEMDTLNDNVKKLLGDKKHTTSQRVFSQNLNHYKFNKIDKDKYRDSQLLESTYFIWYLNNIVQNSEDETNHIITYALNKDELYGYLKKYFTNNPLLKKTLTIDDYQEIDVHKAIRFFFEYINRILLSAFELGDSDNSKDEMLRLKKFFFNKTWNVIRKDLSLWMIPSDSFKGILSE